MTTIAGGADELQRLIRESRQDPLPGAAGTGPFPWPDRCGHHAQADTALAEFGSRLARGQLDWGVAVTAIVHSVLAVAEAAEDRP